MVATTGVVADERREHLREAWEEVVAHLGTLGRISRAMARADDRVDAEEVLHELTLDLVASYGLFDPARGDWVSWARSRARLARLRAIRTRAKHEPRGRVEVRDADQDEDGAGIVPVTGHGAWGSAGRSECQVELGRILDQCDDGQRDALLIRMYGIAPKRAGLSRSGAGSRRARLGEQLGLKAGR